MLLEIHSASRFLDVIRVLFLHFEGPEAELRISENMLGNMGDCRVTPSLLRNITLSSGQFWDGDDRN